MNADPAVAVPGDYRAPAWLRNRHLQTIWPAVVLRPPRIGYRRERWTTPDGDFIDLDWVGPAPAAGEQARPLVALFHGLEGSSASHYARALMATVQSRGWRGVVVHWRGCSGEPNRLARAYHSGDSAEVDWVLRRLRPDFAAGISLGGNALLKWLGEQGSAAAFIRAAAGVSAPHDLHAGAIALASGVNRIYCHNFLVTLKRKSLAKLDLFPGLYDRRQLLAARDFFAFDALVTAPLHGFASAIDYWTRSSCRQFLGGIRVPTLVLNARNDPFLPATALATRHDAAPAVRLEYPAHGGHAGFPQGTPPGRADWLPRRLMEFFAEHR